MMTTQQTQNICIPLNFVQRRPNVFDVGLILYKCYTKLLCFLGILPVVRMRQIVPIRYHFVIRKHRLAYIVQLASRHATVTHINTPPVTENT